MDLHGRTDNSIMIVNILVNEQLRQGRFCSKSSGPLAGRCRERIKSLGRQLLANLAPIVIFTGPGGNARRLASKYRLSSLWWKNVENQLSRWCALAWHGGCIGDSRIIGLNRWAIGGVAMAEPVAPGLTDYVFPTLG